MSDGGISIHIDISGLEQARALVSGLGDRDTTDLMSDIGAVLESHIRERIEETKRAPDGSPWPPNRAGTSTLLATGQHLRDSVAFIAGANEVEVGSSWEFAHVHQDGAVIKPKNAKRLVFMAGKGKVFARRVTIPARPFVGWSAEDEAEVRRLTTDWLMDGLGGAS